jgi:hypothetical protein
MNIPTAQQIARVAHEANRAYCRILGDNSQPRWEDAPDWQKDSALNGVLAHLDGALSPENSHQLWLEEKAREGWTFGAIKDPERKQHPCMVPYEKLPLEQQLKDHLFAAIVAVFKNAYA